MADAPLDEYRAKRDFAVTAEPSGTGSPTPGSGELSFVVHKHAARALHYDLRLEIAGVLASWAVPKGPSLDPADKHLAVQVEDHPLEYGAFEGVIPAGEYGGGTVMIWDRGAFAPLGDPAAGVAKGHLKFVLRGSKLRGAWALVRMKSRPGDKRENWLLIKERDEEARTRAERDVLAEEPDSAASGRTMDRIAASDETYGGLRVGEAPGPEDTAGSEAGLPAGGATAAPMPVDSPFQLATLVDEAPDGPEWIHEIKYDGYRLRVTLEHGRARVCTRNGTDWTERFAGIAGAVAALPATSAMLDGEAVVFDAEGRSDFGLLQSALAERRPDRARLVAFDLLYLDGFDLRAEPLRRRLTLLDALLDAGAMGSGRQRRDTGPLRVAERFEGRGPDFHASTCRLLLEGSVSKRLDRPWVAGRSSDWRKTKCLARQEFVIVGWTDPRGSRRGFGALALGVYGEDGALRYAGRVGTGFSERALADLRSALEPLAVTEPTVRTGSVPTGVHWVQPELVAEVSFREWTREGVVRQPSFRGLREDIDPRGVRRESPARVAGPARPDDGAALVVAGVRVTNPGKSLEPAGVTKRELARYYEAVAPAMLPHLAGRLVTAVRCPHGEEGSGACFFQKHPEPRGWPEALRRTTVREPSGTHEYFHADDAEGLLSLVQLGALEIHTWNSLASDCEHPDRIVFDLDPGEGVGFAGVVETASILREALVAVGMGAFAKTTGGHGLHVVVPIAVRWDHEVVRGWAHALVERLVVADPQRFTAKMSKAARPGHVFVDYLRNAHGATAVCAFSTRARPGAPVSVPVSWTELAAGLDPVAFDLRTVPERLEGATVDPWEGYEAARVPLSPDSFAAVGTWAPDGPENGPDGVSTSMAARRRSKPRR